MEKTLFNQNPGTAQKRFKKILFFCIIITVVSFQSAHADGFEFSLLLKDAERGDIEAMCDLGVAYFKGDLTLKDPFKAKCELGLFDMAGNVKEWCRDIYNKKAYEEHSSRNPVYDKKGFSRVVRGGSFADNTSQLRCTRRSQYIPGIKASYIGFRMVLTRFD